MGGQNGRPISFWGHDAISLNLAAHQGGVRPSGNAGRASTGRGRRARNADVDRALARERPVCPPGPRPGLRYARRAPQPLTIPASSTRYSGRAGGRAVDRPSQHNWGVGQPNSITLSGRPDRTDARQARQSAAATPPQTAAMRRRTRDGSAGALGRSLRSSRSGSRFRG